MPVISDWRQGGRPGSFWGTHRGLLAGGGGRWTPSSLGASLLAHWNADRSDLITLSTTKVTSWKDTVSAIDLAQATDGARPTYSATGFNGSPGVTFDGTDDYLGIESVSLPSGANACEIWVLAGQSALAADATTRLLFAYGSANAAQKRAVARIVTTGTNRARADANNVTVSNTAVDYSGRHIQRARITATGVSIQIDDGALSAETLVTPATGTDRTRLGASTAATAANFWQGPVRDVIVTSLLSAEEAALMTAYLMARRNP